MNASKFRRRGIAILAASAVAGGVAVSAPAAFAATSTPAHPTACAKAHGKYAGKLVHKFTIGGGNDFVQIHNAGVLQVWHSTKCGTAWVKVVKSAKWTHRKGDTVAIIGYYGAHHKWISKQGTANTRYGVESPALTIGAHRTVTASGGWVGDYQFDSGDHNVRL